MRLSYHCKLANNPNEVAGTPCAQPFRPLRLDFLNVNPVTRLFDTAVTDAIPHTVSLAARFSGKETTDGRHAAKLHRNHTRIA